MNENPDVTREILMYVKLIKQHMHKNSRGDSTSKQLTKILKKLEQALERSEQTRSLQNLSVLIEILSKLILILKYFVGF